MCAKICVLSDQTINQIAAGEVIENPASVVKELVENAIDAGARHLKIEILAGGFQLIKISDDGSGMAADDAVLSLERHATSKLSSADDLFTLATMGFRGEALASIAAISKMRLLTAQEFSTATDIEVEGGKILHVGLGSRSRGTSIEVRSLFFNVPARKKFQKSPASSSAEITKTLTQLALAHPEIGFELFQQDRSSFSLPASSGEDFHVVLKRRAGALLGEEFLPSCRDFALSEKGYEGCGLIADPQFSRHNRSGQYLFVNERPVNCPAIAFAIRDAYGTRLDVGKHPVYLLHLKIPSQLVDVNVHPQKKEIRLREETILKYILHSAVNDALGSAGVSAQLSHPTLQEPAFSSFFTEPLLSDFSGSFVFKEERDDLPVPELSFGSAISLIGVHGHYLLVRADSLPAFTFTEKERRASGVVWIDLPAAEARIALDSMMSRSEGVPLSQGLLLPVLLNFSKAESELLTANLDILQKLGIEVRAVGESAFIVESIPPFLNESEIQSMALEIVAELQGQHQEKTWKERSLRHLAAVLSRRARSNRRFYSLEEARLIVQKLMQTSDPLHCPQGKKTLFHVTEDEIERYFSK